MLLKRDARIGHLEDVVGAHKAEIEQWKLLTAKLRRMHCGRKSEKLDRQIERLELRLEELEADEGSTPIETPKTPRTTPEESPRKPLPNHLPARCKHTCRDRLRHARNVAAK